MKKIFSELDKKFIISLTIILVTLLSTAVLAYATVVTTEMESRGSMGTEETINFQGQYLTWEDLKERYDILCCYHGGDDSHLGGRNTPTLKTEAGETQYTDAGKHLGELTKGDEGSTALTITNSEDPQSPYTSESYSAESWAWYEATEIVITSPDNSYILAEMIAEVDPEVREKVFYDNGYTTIQYAWWVTDDNKGTKHNTQNALYYEAEAFYSYIRQIAKSVNEKDFVNTDYEYTDKNGELHSGTVPAPELEYEPAFNEDANQDGKIEQDENGVATGEDKVTATFDTDTNTWTIGPFSIDYVEESFQLADLDGDFEYAQVDEYGNPILDSNGNQATSTVNLADMPQNDRDPVQFAGITNAQLYTNLGEVPLAIKEDEEGIANEIQEVEGAKWKFNFLKDQREVTDKYRFPHSNEVFYIELDYIPGVTKIENLHFDFKYMNAGGRYEKLEGTYFKQTWTPDSEVAEYCPGTCGHSSHGPNSTCDGRCVHGKSSRHPIKWNYWLDLTSMEEKPSQLLAYGVIGARWYEYTELDLTDDDITLDDEWNYEIYKKVVDAQGNEVQTSDKFVFDVYTNGEFFDRVQVRGNVKFKSQTYKVKEGEGRPNVEIKEAFEGDTAENYKLIDIQKTEQDGTFTFTATNQEVEHKGSVSITKHADPEHSNWEFQFKLYIANKLYVGPNTNSDGIITIHPGETWNSGDITYSGKAPTYRVEEVNIPEGAKLYKITNKTGKLSDKDVARVDAYNDEAWDSAEISIKKMLDGGATSSETFTVKLRVGDKTYTKELKAGQTWTDRYVWEKGTPAPTYEVEEINLPEGWTLVNIDNKSGTLAANQKISVNVINDGEDHEGKISVKKEIETDDKIGVDNNLDFPFKIRISGTFECDGESIVNGNKIIETTLKPDETWTSPSITWKGDAPTYSVSEGELPEGWRQIRISNATGTLKDDATCQVVCVNEYKITTEYDLTMAMSGTVWVDAPLNEEDKNTEDSKPNGLLDDSEERLQNVEVLIWKVLYSGQTEVGRVLATGYEEGSDTEISYPIYTSVEGIWSAPRMSVPGITDEEKAQGITRADYDVEFYYDGQTYEPTEFLVTGGGNAAAFRNNTTNAERNKFNKDSMAVDDEAERDAFNNKFATFTGDSPIDDNGVTNGYAEGSNGERTDLVYYGTDSMPSLDGNTRKISELQILENGFIREPFKMPARTSTRGLTFPFDSKYHIDYVDKYLNKIEGGLVIKYHYSATYPYLLNINLGLVKRDEAELAVTKDVYSANVVVNQKLMNYKYNEYVDFESEEYQDYLNLQLKVADANISYKLDLYESDYYYRAKVYEGNEVHGALEEFYRSIGKENISDELDLDVFLTYKINVYNNSDSYLAEVKKLTDYFDEDLELVDTAVTRYIQEANGMSVDEETTVASPAYVIKKGPSGDSMWAEQIKKSLEGKVNVSGGLVNSSTTVETPSSEAMTPSDNVRSEESKNYYKAEIDLSGSDLRLAVGEKLELYLTFKVRTDETPAVFGDGANDATKSYVRLGTKANVAEIGAYSTIYPETNKIAGKVDKDSAPNNVDIESKNEKTWYEDDADSAPVITLDLYTETRNLNGMAWEDEETEEIDYNQKIGNGMYDEGERKIGNLTTEMVEKVRVKQADGTYREYDFVWPTSQSFDFLNGSSLESVTGFDSITLTGNTAEKLGEYGFKNIPAGNYVVRFTYGDFPSDSLDDEGNLVKLDGVAEPQTSDDNSRKPAVYNGQDFKTTEYQADVEHEYAEGGFINDEWYDFDTCDYNDAGEVVSHNSDAIDNEARRLRVIAYSKVLDNTITTALASANKYDADHTELYKNTSMFADTAKINFNIENMHSLSGQRIVITNANTGEQTEVIAGGEETQEGLKSNYVYGKTDVNGEKGTVSLINYAYNVDAIDCGIEERSNTEIVLDKEIEAITVKTNTDDTILKAVYDISYDYDVDRDSGTSEYTANVTLNREKSFGTENLLAQNKDEEAGLQNFRYIYYDDSIAQSLNIEVAYKFTALNVGEVDRASNFLENASVEEILAKADEIDRQIYTKEDGKLKNIYHPNIGEHIGSIYYIGKDEAYTQNDIVATTMVRQLIDYVDNDVVFKSSENTAPNSSWRTVTADELDEKRVIASELIETDDDGNKTILDDYGVAYTTSQRNNLILSVDNVEGEKLTNPGFIIKLVPFTASTQNGELDTSCQTAMAMTMTRSIDSQIEDDDLAYDNIAEIVKFENTVGRRDIETIAGNADPKLGEFAASLEERDASATELITFTPPTGLDTNTLVTTQMLIVAVVALGILVIGIIVIKKTVLK